MLFCPENETFHDIWVDNGTSQCFMETVSTSIIFGIIAIFGTAQLYIYHHYSTPVSEGPLPRSRLYNLQVTLVYIFVLLTLLRFILRATVFNQQQIYGYMVMSLCMIMFMYPYSYKLLSLERNYQLPSVPAKGHGLVLLLFWTLAFISENLALINIRKQGWWFHLDNASDSIEMSLFVGRYVTCLLIFVLGLKAPGILTTRDYLNLQGSSSSLLNESGPPTSGVGSAQGSTWRNFWHKMGILAPFLWPKKDVILQIIVLCSFLLLAAGRVINLYVPIYSKLIVDSMTDTPLVFRWDLVLIYVAFKFLQGGGTGGMGLLNNLRSFLWIKVQQYTTREVEVDVFKHIHSLSLRWHLSRKTGEVIRIVDRGTDSINNLLNYILFSIMPCIVDILIAVGYFIIYFNIYYGIIVFVTMALYLTFTILVTEWRTKYQRKMNLADNAAKAKCTDSLLNYETVKYYCAEDYEVSSYRTAIINYQTEEWRSIVTLNILNTVQNVVISSGLLAGSLLCVHMVVAKEGLTVGDYVLFSSYIVQLYVPLNWFGTYYRMIQKNFVDMENMFELLKEQRDVDDLPEAPALTVRDGAVEFKDVTFGYLPERVILKGISFKVPPGKTMALVGPSGSGKTTVMRLLFRFYDVDAGAVFIDGQNIRHLQQKSVRQAIGVVPQDTVLFNDTIKYNVQYGRLNAGDMDVIEAAKSAEIHQKIVTFPQGYETMVGERGLKLSGGEKQRVAIARTVLKNPPVVLLDEATSALDTETERNIQASMDRLWENTTMIIVAHRLSTIVHADEICVMREGEIVERGTHEELMEKKQVYWKMWEDQLKNKPEKSAQKKTEEVKAEAPVAPPPHHHHH